MDRHPFAAFTTMLKTITARDTADLGTAVKRGLQLLNLHKLSSGTDTYGQGYAPHAVEPSLLLLLTDGCDPSDVSLEDGPQDGSAGIWTSGRGV
eukprot:jgi/Botrbrau1/6297/Bobra.0339s0008.1